MAMMSATMNDWVRNRFRIEPQGSQTAKSGNIVQFTLPESALIHLPSIRFFFDVACTSETENGTTVYGKLPADAESLISKLEIYIGGVQIQNGSAEYNTIAKILKISQSSTARDESVDRCLSHSAINNANSADAETLCLHEWRGFLGECASEYLPTDLTGAVQIRLTFAQPNVLVPKEDGQDVGADLSADAKIAASRLTYSVSNMWISCDSVIPPDAYNQALRERLSQGDIRVNYKDYYTQAMSGCGSSFTHRFGVSSASLDRVYQVMRDSNYLEAGIKGYDLTDASGGQGDAFVSNAFRFRTFDNGNATYQFNLNNVAMPQYRATMLEALADVHYGANKLGCKAQGSLITDRASFKEGLGVIPLILNCPDENGVSVRSGYNTKGINAQLCFNAQGLTTPSVNATTQETSDRTSFVVSECTQQLCVGVGKQISVVY
jgi:hypothetical protein